ncbi:hypothetical protein [Nitratidesulfovibrio liaohensis]|uniref:Uncharacterized protein n=1 Tax=Nitratidesulfovibrio liaohensis TaxID=2604158 RepID=A0ABY9QWZ8_9BACT|nr:hypothetical protein [Nitratidesulfovibrio liaohensis]WMW64043.1 hypothetical protein KPS_002022 [Nitratidesulfovibrio liaohensis]
MDIVTDAFEEWAHSMRVLFEAHSHAHYGGLLNVDSAEAVGNIEVALSSVLNAFHSMNDILKKIEYDGKIDWYGCPELAIILVLRNARHHNHARKIRTMYTYYFQEAEQVGSMERYVLVNFPLADGENTFEVYLSWADLKFLFSISCTETRIKPEVMNKISSYIGCDKFCSYSSYYEVGEDNVFFNIVPLIVNAAIKIVPTISSLMSPRSLEGRTMLNLFCNGTPAKTKEHEVNAGPIAYVPWRVSINLPPSHPPTASPTARYPRHSPC